MVAINPNPAPARTQHYNVGTLGASENHRVPLDKGCRPYVIDGWDKEDKGVPTKDPRHDLLGAGVRLGP